MTRIYLIRHGESEGNANRIYLGHTDLGLSQLGRLQAEKTAEELSDVPFSCIYSSDLKRAMETAEPHARRRSLFVKPLEKLREFFLGDWEGALIDDLEKTEEFTIGWRENFGSFTIPGGECVADGAERLYDALSLIGEAHGGETVAVVFHAGVLRAFWGKMTGLPRESWANGVPFPANASYSIVEYENGRFTPIKYSVSEHLLDL